MRYDELNTILKAEDPYEALRSLIQRDAQLCREQEAMQESVDRMNENIRWHEEQRSQLRSEISKLLKAMQLQEMRKLGASEEDLRAHFS